MILTVTPNPSVDRTLRVPGFRAGGTFKAELLALRPAGKGLNVSRCLDAVGVPSAATGLVGAGELASFTRSFAGTRVEPEFVATQSPVRASTTVVDPTVPCETHVRERGGNVSPGEVDALEESIRRRVTTGGWLAACGSLPVGLASSRYAGLLLAARERGARVALDSSGEGLAAAREARPDLLKPNRSELAELAKLAGLASREFGSRDEAVEAAQSLVGECAGALLVTLGAEGALLVTEGTALAARCEPEGFVSSVGAGDAALAGYLWAQTRGEPADSCLRAAVAAGAASLSEPVAGGLDRERFERLRARAVVQAV